MAFFYKKIKLSDSNRKKRKILENYIGKRIFARNSRFKDCFLNNSYIGGILIEVDDEHYYIHNNGGPDIKLSISKLERLIAVSEMPQE